MELYSEREWERVELLTNVEGVCLKTGYYSWKRELLVTIFGRQSRVPCPVNHFWVCEKYRWSQRGGGELPWLGRPWVWRPRAGSVWSEERQGRPLAVL